MAILVSLFRPLERALNKLGICSSVGFMAGGITGFVLFCFYLNNSTIPIITIQDLLRISAMLWIFVFLVILFILVVFCRFTIGSVFFQTLVNTLFSSFLTTFLVNAVKGWQWAFFIGALLGLLIGRLFCWICQNIKRK